MILGIIALAVVAICCLAQAREHCILCHNKEKYCGACAAKATRRLMAGNKFKSGDRPENTDMETTGVVANT